MNANDVTAIVKTFERPQCLQALMESFRGKYPSLPAIIVDDSRSPYAIPYRDSRTEIIILDFDSGVAAGRNAGLAACRSKYFVLFDDDFLVDEHTDIGGLIKQLERFDLDVLAGEVIEPSASPRFDRPLGYNAHFDVCEDEFGKVVTVSKARIESPITRCDLVANFFVAKTAAVRDRVCGWDDTLKIAEHTEFFFRAKQAGLRVGLVPTISVNHLRPTPDANYGPYRARGNTPAFHQFWLRKHNIRRLQWFDGTETVLQRGQDGIPTYVRRKARVGPAPSLALPTKRANRRIRPRVRGIPSGSASASACAEPSAGAGESQSSVGRFTANLQLLNDLLRPTELENAYCVFCGLLLGWIREGRPLGHDCRDADFLILDRDWWRLMRSMPVLEEAGFRRRGLWVANGGGIAEVTLEKDSAKFEFFRGERIGHMYRHFAFTANEQIAYQYPAFDFTRREFLGRIWNRPAEAEQHLAYYYGDWKTPRPKFNYARDIRAIVGREPWHGQSFHRWE